LANAALSCAAVDTLTVRPPGAVLDGDGLGDFDALGEVDGDTDGLGDFDGLGEVDGDGLGEADGDRLGEADGDRLGEADGDRLGEADGDRLGDFDGLGEDLLGDGEGTLPVHGAPLTRQLIGRPVPDSNRSNVVDRPGPITALLCLLVTE
jgi:hypothetical protein